MFRTPKIAPAIGSRLSLQVLEDRSVPAIMFDWALGAGSSTVDRGYAIAADSTGVYVTGDFEDTVDFDPGPGTVNFTNVTPTDGFVAKYSPTRTLIWAQHL